MMRKLAARTPGTSESPSPKPPRSTRSASQTMTMAAMTWTMAIWTAITTAAHHPRLAPEEVGHDDELAVPRPERVDGAIGERHRKRKEKRGKILAALDGVHVQGDLGVGAALKVHQDVRHPLEEAAAVVGDLDRDGGPRSRIVLRERGRRREDARQKADSGDEQHRERAEASSPPGPVSRHRLALAGERDGARVARLRPRAARDAERASGAHYAADQHEIRIREVEIDEVFPIEQADRHGIALRIQRRREGHGKLVDQRCFLDRAVKSSTSTPRRFSSPDQT